MAVRIRVTIGTIALSVALTACGQTANDPAAVRATAAGPAATTTRPDRSVESNQRVLTRAASLRLVGWAKRFRHCAEADGIGIAALRAERRQIVMTTRRKWQPNALASKSIRCGDRLGEPPKGSSLQVSRDGTGFVLYLPIQCLLDEDVRRQHS